MGRLVLVRHGQASFFGDNYDRLSELGWTQSRALGRWWRGNGPEDIRLWQGPRRRHAETARGFAEAGAAPADVRTHAAFDEYPAEPLITRVLADDALRARVGGADLAALGAGGDSAKRAFQQIFQRVTLGYVRGDWDAMLDGLETWTAFRERVAAGLREVIREAGRGRTVVVMTSGGPMAAAAGQALGLDDERTLELSWRIRNAALVELLWRSDDADGTLTLDVFNAHPHLNPDQITWR